jgi:CheY-like chemotaxis protein
MRPKNILVVDDEVDMKSLYEQRFRREIRQSLVHIAFASSGKEALSYIKDHEQDSLLVLSDINMPEMTGFELLERIKEEQKNPPPVVMMVSAYGDAENYSKAIRMGADDFVTKPIDFTLLKQKLNLQANVQDTGSR